MILTWLCLLSIISASAASSPTVTTDCGAVAGVASSTSDAVVFKGIKYAVAERWMPPKSLKEAGQCWQGTLQADKFGSVCYQRSFVTKQLVGSEDCLFLNVWASARNLQTEAKKPVLLFIHGGSLIEGAGSDPYVLPDSVQELQGVDDFVYVTINYRLSAFGFMALDELSARSPHKTSSNYGIMDQIKALEWVQTNIAAFGGDPDNVTLLGQSSGATSVIALMASPLAKGLFRRAWSMSGSYVWKQTTAQASVANRPFVKAAGCSSPSNGTSVLDCLLALSPAEVYDAIPWDTPPYWSLPLLFQFPQPSNFSAAIMPIDGYVLPGDPMEVIGSGRGNAVDFVIGSGAQEIDFEAAHDLSNLTQAQYEAFVEKKLAMFDPTGQLAKNALALYTAFGLNSPPQLGYTSMLSDILVSCGNDALATNTSRGAPAPTKTYRYVFTSRPMTPICVFAPNYCVHYSFHLWDLVNMFNTTSAFLYKAQPPDMAFGATLRKALAQFMTTGTIASWPVVTPQQPSHVIVDDSGAHAHASDFWHAKACAMWWAPPAKFYWYGWSN